MKAMICDWCCAAGGEIKGAVQTTTSTRHACSLFSIFYLILAILQGEALKMKKLYLYIVFFSLSVFGYAQNLVPNPGFEQADSCNPGQNISAATGWKSYSATPDYYNACADTSTGTIFSIPYNTWGYEPAYGGNAYAGFYSYFSGAGNEDLREYIGRD